MGTVQVNHLVHELHNSTEMLARAPRNFAKSIILQTRKVYCPRTYRVSGTFTDKWYPRQISLSLSSIHGIRLSRCFPGGHNQSIQTAEYEEIKDLINHPQKLLIDVREPNEFQGGKIPTSINIPLATIIQELGSGVSPAEFEVKYGRRKPDEETAIIFSCLKGIRSHQAAKAAVSLGFRNVKSYEGSWLDWTKREPLAK